MLLLFGIALISATLVGWILDTTDESSGFARWDQSAAEWGAERGTETSTRWLEAITQLGASGWLLIIMALVGGIESYRHRNIAIAGYLAVVGLGVSALNNLLKHLVDRERPSVRPLTEFSSSSFPSGHAAAAAACWAANRARRCPALGSARTNGRCGCSDGDHHRCCNEPRAAWRALADRASSPGATVGWAWFFVITLVFGGRILRFGEPAERIADLTNGVRVGSGGRCAEASVGVVGGLPVE